MYQKPRIKLEIQTGNAATEVSGDVLDRVFQGNYIKSEERSVIEAYMVKMQPGDWFRVRIGDDEAMDDPNVRNWVSGLRGIVSTIAKEYDWPFMTNGDVKLKGRRRAFQTSVYKHNKTWWLWVRKLQPVNPENNTTK